MTVIPHLRKATWAARVIHGSMKEAVDEHRAALLVELVLHRVAAQWILDYDIDFPWRIVTDRDLGKWHMALGTVVTGLSTAAMIGEGLCQLYDIRPGLDPD